MNQLHIYCYGVIANSPFVEDDGLGFFSLRTLTEQLNAYPDIKDVVFHIHSIGGDVNEGFAIYDTLVTSGRNITTVVDGECSSIATVVFLAGKERLMNPNSEFMIHNPWGVIEGDGQEVLRYGGLLKKSEKRILDFYIDNSGGDPILIAAMMAEETTLTADEAVELGFATGILKPILAKAKAFINPKTNNKMSNKNVKSAQSLLSKFKAWAKGSRPVALDLTTDAGETITIETDETNEPKLGDAVTIDGELAGDGNYTIADTGQVVTVEDGVITALEDGETPEETGDEEETIAALKAEVKTLTTRLQAKDRNEKEFEKVIGEFQKEFESMKSSGSKYKPKAAASKKTPVTSQENRFAKFKAKK